uniref:PDEase domain-containing protein n=1 Tax=Macrostomum lignano TaxID=282301 RepID=A0A1I8JSD0_9PLAT
PISGKQAGREWDRLSKSNEAFWSRISEYGIELMKAFVQVNSTRGICCEVNSHQRIFLKASSHQRRLLQVQQPPDGVFLQVKQHQRLLLQVKSIPGGCSCKSKATRGCSCKSTATRGLLLQVNSATEAVFFASGRQHQIMLKQLSLSQSIGEELRPRLHRRNSLSMDQCPLAPASWSQAPVRQRRCSRAPPMAVHSHSGSDTGLLLADSSVSRIASRIAQSMDNVQKRRSVTDSNHLRVLHDSLTSLTHRITGAPVVRRVCQQINRSVARWSRRESDFVVAASADKNNVL